MPKYQPSFDVVQFIESPLGLSFSKNLGPNGLFPVQKFVLKMMFGVPLSGEPGVIDIPRGWRDVDSDKRWDRLKLSEFEYLEYLIDKGRAHPSVVSGRPKGTSLALGRRSGTSTMLSFSALYDIFCLLEDPDVWNTLGVPHGAMTAVTTVSMNRDSASILSSETQNNLQRCQFLRDSVSRKTRRSFYFKRLFENEKSETVRLMCQFYDFDGIRGSASKSVYFDCAVGAEDSHLQAFLPGVSSFGGGSYVMATAPSDEEDTFCEMFWRNADLDEGLALRIPSWELNPTIPQHFFEQQHRSDPKVFEHEFGAKVPELS